jgi:hypothetical protein
VLRTTYSASARTEPPCLPAISRRIYIGAKPRRPRRVAATISTHPLRPTATLLEHRGIAHLALFASSSNCCLYISGWHHQGSPSLGAHLYLARSGSYSHSRPHSSPPIKPTCRPWPRPSPLQTRVPHFFYLLLLLFYIHYCTPNPSVPP